MQDYVHARLGKEDRNILRELRKVTGKSTSSLVKNGLKLVYQQEVQHKKSALEVAGKSVGKFSSNVRDLSTNKKHMEGYGK